MNGSAEFASRLTTAQAPLGAGIGGWIERTAGVLREFGPYMAIELILPGGSLLALLLWLCRRQQKAAATGRHFLEPLWGFCGRRRSKAAADCGT